MNIEDRIRESEKEIERSRSLTIEDQIREVNKLEKDITESREKAERFHEAWHTSRKVGKPEPPYEIDENLKAEFFEELGISEQALRYMILGSDRFIEESEEFVQKRTLNGKVKETLGCIENAISTMVNISGLPEDSWEDGLENPYEEEAQRTYEDARWVGECVIQNIQRCIKALNSESQSVRPSEEVWLARKRYHELSEWLQSFGDNIAVNKLSNADINYDKSEIEQKVIEFDKTNQFLKENNFISSDEKIEEGSYSVTLQYYKAAIAASFVMLNDTLKIMSLVEEDSSLARRPSRVPFPESELDRAIIVVWELVKALGKKPIQFFVTCCMHFLGYEQLYPTAKDRTDPVINRWATRYYSIKNTLGDASQKLSDLTRPFGDREQI